MLSHRIPLLLLVAAAGAAAFAPSSFAPSLRVSSVVLPPRTDTPCSSVARSPAKTRAADLRREGAALGSARRCPRAAGRCTPDRIIFVRFALSPARLFLSPPLLQLSTPAQSSAQTQ
jgi:hypothetical protein